MELLWVMYKLSGGSYRLTQPNGPKQVSKCIQIFPGSHSRLVSVAQIFLGSAGPGLTYIPRYYAIGHFCFKLVYSTSLTISTCITTSMLIFTLLIP